MSTVPATPENLRIWDAVRTPDPAHTKSFKRAGGFNGTATNAVYLIRCATELWGPIGGDWGINILEESMLTGAPILHKDVVIGHEQIHVLRIELRHPKGVVPAFGQTTFVGVNKYGPYTDEEAPKKSLTDALTKALSWLGFAADVHMGMWDDNRYVNDVRSQKAAERKRQAKKDDTDLDEEGGGEGGADDKGGLPWYAESLKQLTEATDAKVAGKVWNAAKAECKKREDPEAYQLLHHAAEAASLRINGPKK